MLGMTQAPTFEPTMTALVDQFRLAMRHVGSTVTIITTEAGRRFGMVATAMMSVSLEPPTLAICVNRNATIHDVLIERGRFCVNVLSQSDEKTSRRFSVLSGEARFDAGEWTSCEFLPFEGVPILKTAQANLLCSVRDCLVQGTHTLILGQVEHAQGRPGGPLLYCDGSYGGFEFRGVVSPAALDDRLALYS